jgi:hypothetical protein
MRMAKPVTLALVAGLICIAAAGPALAKRVIYSYDSATPLTRTMTENGITLILDKSLMSVRVLTLAETEDIGEANFRPAQASDLGRGGLSALVGPDAHEHDLYEIIPKGDGRALISAMCPGADKGWMAFGLIKLDQDLRIRVLGRDAASGQTRLCRTLDYAFHGEWTAPPPILPQPDRTDRFNDAPNNRPF